VIFLFCNIVPIKFIQTNVENVQQKYLLMRQLANEVAKTGAGPMWIAILSSQWTFTTYSLPVSPAH
jgi:hypothetical protein